MATTSPISTSPITKVATPLTHRKRRHSALDGSGVDAVDTIHNGHDEKRTTPTPTAQAHAIGPGHPQGHGSPLPVRDLQDDDGEDDENKSLIEDILDTAELEPYKNGRSLELRYKTSKD